ncbi:MAG: hypothetical protein DWH99_02525 [Planctomycetota bacterium]|nr:MAG: hypothetical protein DWH99_02525 [Planctomycetota bacterium]
MYPGRRFALPWAISFCPFGAGTPQPYRCVGCRSILRCGNHVFALIAEDLEGFVQDRSQLREDRATANATTFVMLDLSSGMLIRFISQSMSFSHKDPLKEFQG